MSRAPEPETPRRRRLGFTVAAAVFVAWLVWLVVAVVRHKTS